MIAVAAVLLIVASEEEEFLWYLLAFIAALGSTLLHLGALL